MKKFILKFSIFCLLFMLSALILLIYDPYNVFHYKNIRSTGITPNSNYIKMRYILDNPGKFNAYIFGSSRVGLIDVDNIDTLKCYNMTYPGGLPIEYFENLEVMINSNIIPDTVLVGIDDLAFFLNPAARKTDLMCMPYPKEAVQNNFAYIQFLIKYLNPRILSSLRIILFHKKDEQGNREQFYGNGGFPRGDESLTNEYYWKTAEPVLHPYGYGIENTLADIQKIIDLCNKNNIRLIIFTNPLHIITYQYAVNYGYIDFLAKLSDISNYYNFAGINDVTANNDYYFEISHYKHAVGDMIINAIFNNTSDERLLSQGFGYYVTKENRDTLIETLHAQSITVLNDQ